MDLTPTWMFVASYQEWLNWIETGRIRCNHRIARIRNSRSDDDFAALMDLAPDVSTIDDQAFVLARLKPDYKKHLEPVVSTTLVEPAWLSIEAVEEFLPVSERGARLIESDAQRAWVRIGKPKYQSSWETWTRAQFEDGADKRGRMLVKSLGLSTQDISSTPETIQQYLKGEEKPPMSKVEQFKATRAMAWGKACSTLSELVGMKKIDKQNKKLKISKEFDRLKQEFDISIPITDDKKMLSISDKLDTFLKQSCDSEISMRFLVTVFHYLEVLSLGKEITIPSLVHDIKEIASSNGTAVAANAAYYVGRHMKDIEVTKLCYANKPRDYPALSPDPLSFQLDVTAVDKRTNEASASQAQKKKSGKQTKKNQLNINVDNKYQDKLFSDSDSAQPIKSSETAPSQATAQDEGRSEKKKGQRSTSSAEGTN